ncbi:hypothetical protein MNBD_GAMMA15-238 [hydrothermal vent metagenome]|uniref:DUF3570 domain-containing protein n=1 Tax=hydrothermal vent metagenome TaxID=652676 RepID=A0A3B0YCS2_9ZZZZ
MRVAPRADTGVVVVATKTWRRRVAAALLSLPLLANAAILPEDRSDALYHSYDGGGLTVTGPSILVRKGDAKRFSVNANYYADSITSASIDVVTQGSEYNESRDQYSIGVDYLNANTIMSLGYSNSEESDYKSDTYSITMSQTMFGNMTTVTIGYSRGMDDIFRNGDPLFAKTADHQNYHISLTQVLTKDLLLSINFDTITDEGFLNNPYRSFAYEEAATPGVILYASEEYPDTRTSNAISANFLYYLPYRATIKAGYRFYADDWDITAHTVSLSYVHPFRDRWIFETGYRYYTQSSADFYSDLFSGPDTQNFKARDKELSDFFDHSISLGVSYEIPGSKRGFIDRATLNLKYTYIMFEYDNFSDLRDPSRPSYDFTADVIAAFASIWY